MSRPLVMSFRPDAAAMCLSVPPRKTQTRRIWHEDWCREFDMRPQLITIWDSALPKRNRILWRVGDSIAIKPARTAKAVGRVVCTGLRVERVQAITEADARAEGVDPVSTFRALPGHGELEYRSYRDGFRAVWQRLYPTGPRAWDANPLVVVITFEPMEGTK